MDQVARCCPERARPDVEALPSPAYDPAGYRLHGIAPTGLIDEGDTCSDGVLLNMLPGADRSVSLRSMRRLRDLPVQMVHGGHKRASAASGRGS